MITNKLACDVHNITEQIALKGARVIRWTMANKDGVSLVFPEDQMALHHPQIVVSDVAFTTATAQAYIDACAKWVQPFTASAERARAARRRLRQTARAKIDREYSARV